jgi:hypothetical protein
MVGNIAFGWNVKRIFVSAFARVDRQPPKCDINKRAGLPSNITFLFLLPPSPVHHSSSPSLALIV